MKKKVISVILSALLAATAFAGCGSDKGSENSASSETEKAAGTTETADSGEAPQGDASDSQYEDFITVDVFDSQSNYQGIQSGWFAKIVKDKFNMELNIIAPNVAGGGDTLFQTRSAAGDLGDIIITGAANGRLQNLVTAGLVMDMTDLLKDKENIHRYDSAIEKTAELVEEDGIYAIPSEVSSNSPTTSSEGLEPNYGVYVRWDAYKAAGYPEVNTLEDLLPVLQKMQESVPESDSGKKTYAISLFKDWDGNLMTNAKPEASLYGYDEIGFVLAKADGSDYQSLIESDSPYIRSLKFLFDANQMGLVDPESTTQNYDTLFTKYQDGQILFAPYAWLGQGAYNTEANKTEGKGFMFVPVKDETIFSYGCQVNGNAQNCCIMIGSKAEDPQRMADFIDWLYSPEGVMDSCAQTANTCGPEGLTWEVQDGQPVLTDFGKQALYGEAVNVPDEWGGGSWKDGVSALNYKAVNQLDSDPNTGICYDYTTWDSVLESQTSELTKDWQEKMGAQTTMDYLADNNQILVAPGSGYVVPEEDSQITTLRGQCKASIVEYSWKMVFASDEDEFNSLLDEMQTTLKGLDYEKVLEYDMECAKAQNDARVEVVETYEAENGNAATETAADDKADTAADGAADDKADTAAENDTTADTATDDVEAEE
ncbi:MAG: ABC transporter substrate-binding protein [Eubacteriales bacterium]|nr:ABC transporter substrate-binding protein [Eubacteriales bacterium]